MRFKRNLKLPERLENSVSELIESDHKKYGKGGTERAKLEFQADLAGMDRDHTNGLDDGEGPWNQPNK